MSWFMIWVVLVNGQPAMFGGQAYGTNEECAAVAYQRVEALIEMLGPDAYAEATCVAFADAIEFSAAD